MLAMSPNQLAKGSHLLKSELVMEFFRKGFDNPPPLSYGSYGTNEAHLIFGHQKGVKHNFPKHPKLPY